MGKHRYGVILDAGSSGSRVYIYRWKNAQAAQAKADQQELQSLPQLKTKKEWRLKVKPGISTFGDKPELVGPDHLKELVKFAQDIVPKDEIENTPIFLLATAGMRLLPENQRQAVLESTCSYFKENSGFQLPDCALHIQVIPGETEGLYGWIAANYLLGGFDAPEKHDHGKGHHTYGFLDMGGASAQIAFAPNATEAEKHANDLKLLRMRKVNGEAEEYRVFVTTWLGFGANEARRRYVESLLEAYPDMQEVPDPCLPVGLLVDQTGQAIVTGPSEMNSGPPHLVGTGDFAECLKRTFPLLEKDKLCEEEPCLLNGVHTPAIDFDVNHFVGVSEYWYQTHEVFASVTKEKAYDFHTYQKQVSELCSRDWTDLIVDVGKQKWGKKVDEKTVEEVCFKASWLINMMHDGIGIPRVGLEPVKEPGTGLSNKTNAVLDKAKDRGFLDPFQAVDKIDGTEVSWTLGKMVLYASSQMPATDGSLAVGFGSNEPGVALPADFQYAGGKYQSLPGDLDDTDDDFPTDWHDRIFDSSSYSRRLPGILIFSLIMVLAVYLLCGRERRLALYRKLLTLVGRSNKSGGTPKWRRGLRKGDAGAYERVLEDAAPADAEDFELADAPEEDDLSDHAATTRTGRASGWSTPAARAMSPDVTRASPKGKGYFDHPASGGGGNGNNGLGITPFERGGLSVRTESKERLAPKDTKGTSRAGSPQRRSPGVVPFKAL